MTRSVPSQIVEGYEQLLSLGSEHVDEIGLKIPIPHVREAQLMELTDHAVRHFTDQPINLTLVGDYYIIGDIHGNLVDLLRLLYEVHRPPFSRILFLGDYVDRGPFSVEVLTLILALSCAYPESVYMLRGNHEFSSINRTYGFYDEIISVYKSESLWSRFQDVFAWLPLTATVNGSLFCVHGGISQHVPLVHQIERITRPIYHLDDPAVIDFVWADPCTLYPRFGTSRRGYGFGFGAEAAATFLRANNFTRIVRAHQFITGGVEEALGGRVMTIFSTSTGAETCRNLVGVLKVTEHGENHPILLVPGPIVKRADAQFKECALEQKLYRRGVTCLPNDKSRRPMLARFGKNIARGMAAEPKLRLRPSASSGWFDTSGLDLVMPDESLLVAQSARIASDPGSSG